MRSVPLTAPESIRERFDPTTSVEGIRSFPCANGRERSTEGSQGMRELRGIELR